MGKMTHELIEELYSNGKAVYYEKMSLRKATDYILEKYPENIHKSSAEFYISLYGELISGKGSTWNQNSDLLLYYVRHILDENSREDGINAYKGAKRFAEAKSRGQLLAELSRIALEYELKLDPESNTVSDIEETKVAITSQSWLTLLAAPDVFTPPCLEAMACMMDNGGSGTCTELGNKYGQSMVLYRTTCGVHLAKRVAEKVKCEVPKKKDGTNEYWPILFLGDKAKQEDVGSFVYTIRPELQEALIEFGIEKYLPERKEEEKPMEEFDSLPSDECISRIQAYIAVNGFAYDESLIKNFYLSLKSKPFVILAGTSGTGKTKLVKLFADAIGAKYYPVPVRPDWSDGSDLFGHNDLNGDFIKGPVCECFEYAFSHPEQPVFLCLDEMNLARVEYYLSDFLSVIESREWREEGGIKTAEIKQYEQGIPDNLYVIGTVNMDETTFPFSKKVLDRANTIEFNYVDLMPAFAEAGEQQEPLHLSNDFLRSEYLVLEKDCAVDKDYVQEICGKLQKINEILLMANAHVGYRVRDEIVFYMLNNKHADMLLTEEEALDYEIMQKILPRIQGSSEKIRDMLVKLFCYCVDEDPDHSHGLEKNSGNAGSEMLRKVDEGNGIKYPVSAKKIGFMMMRYEEDGFTSYWL